MDVLFCFIGILVAPTSFIPHSTGGRFRCAHANPAASSKMLESPRKRQQQIFPILRCTLPVRSRYDVASLDALPLRWRCAPVALEGWFQAASTTLTTRLERSESVINSRIYIINMRSFHYAEPGIPLRSRFSYDSRRFGETF